MTAAKFFVEGRVQGVFFRETTRRQAEKLDLRGYAINLPDGRVEIVAAGDPGRIEALERWLWVGSAQSKVSNVERADLAEDDVQETGFRTG